MKDTFYIFQGFWTIFRIFFFYFLFQSLCSFQHFLHGTKLTNYIIHILKCCTIKRKVFLCIFQVCQCLKILHSLSGVEIFIKQYFPKSRDSWLIISPEPREKWHLDSSPKGLPATHVKWPWLLQKLKYEYLVWSLILTTTHKVSQSGTPIWVPVFSIDPK